MSDSQSITDVWEESMTDAEKRQAFLAAVLDGQRVEPFATWCDVGQAAIDAVSPGTKTLATMIEGK